MMDTINKAIDALNNIAGSINVLAKAVNEFQGERIDAVGYVAGKDSPIGKEVAAAETTTDAGEESAKEAEETTTEEVEEASTTLADLKTFAKENLAGKAEKFAKAKLVLAEHLKDGEDVPKLDHVDPDHYDTVMEKLKEIANA